MRIIAAFQKLASRMILKTEVMFYLDNLFVLR